MKIQLINHIFHSKCPDQKKTIFFIKRICIKRRTINLKMFRICFNLKVLMIFTPHKKWSSQTPFCKLKPNKLSFINTTRFFIPFYQVLNTKVTNLIVLKLNSKIIISFLILINLNKLQFNSLSRICYLSNNWRVFFKN